MTEDWSRYTTMEPILRVDGLSADNLRNLLIKAYLNFVPSSIWNFIKRRELKMMGKIILEASRMMRGLIPYPSRADPDKSEDSEMAGRGEEILLPDLPI